MCNVIDKKMIFLNTSFKSQQEVFDFLADKMVEDKRGNSSKKMIDGFYQREQEYSTAINDNIAIPHCRIEEIEKATVIVLRNKNKIKWTDDEEVNLFFALMIPASNENQMHIKILAQVAQLIMEDSFINIVKDSDNVDAIYQGMHVINDLI